jgi:hypothetical protein
LIHNSSIAGATGERLGVLIVFFEDFDAELCVVSRKRFDVVVVVVVVFAPPIAVLTAGTVDDELDN